MRRIRLAAIFVGSALLATGAVHQPATAAAPLPIGCQHEQAQIRAVPAGVVNSWAQENAAGVAAQFTADADFISGEGEYVPGSAAIEPYFAALFAPGGFLDGTRVTAVPNKVVCLDWNIARIITLGGILFPGETEVQPDWRGIQSWVVVRQSSAVWKAQLFHNSRTLLTELPDN
jgi:uncharacterized protein (TIGR02246 family)